jgi:hypothetical protein
MEHIARRVKDGGERRPTSPLLPGLQLCIGVGLQTVVENVFEGSLDAFKDPS